LHQEERLKGEQRRVEAELEKIAEAESEAQRCAPGLDPTS
jgi:hypothetical protein